MLSKLFACRRLLASPTSPLLMQVSARHFRSDFVNPYKQSPINLTEGERQKQEELPVWDRTFDYKKYMSHDGPLKVPQPPLLIFFS